MAVTVHLPHSAVSMVGRTADLGARVPSVGHTWYICISNMKLVRLACIQGPSTKHLVPVKCHPRPAGKNAPVGLHTARPGALHSMKTWEEHRRKRRLVKAERNWTCVWRRDGSPRNAIQLKHLLIISEGYWRQSARSAVYFARCPPRPVGDLCVSHRDLLQRKVSWYI